VVLRDVTLQAELAYGREGRAVVEPFARRPSTAVELEALEEEAGEA
jgi:hypothetical protein